MWGLLQKIHRYVIGTEAWAAFYEWLKQYGVSTAIVGMLTGAWGWVASSIAAVNSLGGGYGQSSALLFLC